MSGATIDNPILNGPYDAPARHFVIGPNGITGEIADGRRLSESYIPVPPARKSKKAQEALDFDVTGERRDVNTLINDIRRDVELWRGRGYPGVTPYTRKLLQHWADSERENRVLFCQREAAETAIFLAEVAGRHGIADYRTRVDEENRLHNDRLPRIGLKMATGAGKTVVIAMLIAWQSVNKAFTPNDARFTRRFLIVTPGITIRDRLRVLLPSDEANYYRERDLVPADLWSAVLRAEIVITNYHAFLPKDTKEIAGVASNTRKILIAGKKRDPFKETAEQVVARVLRDFGSSTKGEVLVLNDEAHHCYRDKPLEDPDDADAESKVRNEDARRWFLGLQAVRRKVGVKAIYDLSATPFYLKGSGWNEGYIFPWVVSDFSLMDAIESGIVKVPRIPVDDNATTASVVYKHLWDHVGDHLPKRKLKVTATSVEWVPPPTLQGALESLYDSYAASFARWQTSLEKAGEPPPVFIVVCPNTVVSKLVFDWIAGHERVLDDDIVVRVANERLPLLSNVDERTGRWLDRPRTIIVDSVQLESGESMKDDFKAAAGVEIEAFKDEYRRRYPGADVDKITDEDLLREVMNTVGKKGRLGEGVRCVVSVSMLTEGWDANTVTHILGIRAFRSQLLCEQVVGRGLRRRSYEVNDDGHFEPEYAEVYGVPFNFLSSERPVGPDVPRPPAIEVRALPERSDLRITFPNVEGYRLEIPDETFFANFEKPEAHLHVDRTVVATRTATSGIAGTAAEQKIVDYESARRQRVAFEIASTLVQKKLTVLDDAPRPWLFPQVLDIVKQWLDTCVTYEPGCDVGMLLLAEGTHRAAETLYSAVLTKQEQRLPFLFPILRRFDPDGTTDTVRFATRKVAIETTKSHVSHVVLDGVKGNTWEETVALLLEKHDSVHSYVKNDHLGFQVPYVHAGSSHHYLPDFIVRLADRPGDDTVRTLIVEVSGTRKDASTTRTKAVTARSQWCRSVNTHGGWGLWGYAEITEMGTAASALDAAISTLYAGGPITGLHDG